MNRTKVKAGVFYQASSLSKIKNVAHGFGTKGVGLDNYLTYLGNNETMFAQTAQKHGNTVHIIGNPRPKGILEGDAFISNARGSVCFVRTADCVPVLLSDKYGKVVGAVHMGWRGAISNVIGAAIKAIKESFGCAPSELLAAIGPAICEKCYCVGAGVVRLFKEKNFSDAIWNGDDSHGGMKLNLGRVAFELLVSSQVSQDLIETLPLCTGCSGEEFVSYRKSRNEKLRQVNFIFIK